MTYLLFQWSRWDYKYLLKAPEPDCWVLFSKDYKQRVLRYLSGSIPVVRMSKKDDMTDIPYQQFMKCLCQSKMVCMPIDCESPQGLIVMFEAAANNKMILISDTPTTQEYSGPKSGNWGYEIECTEPVRTWYHCDRHRVGCLYTGDSTCDLKGWENAKYSGVWDLIGTIQLPHHGSVESFDVATNPIDRSYVFPVSFGTYNTYGHPSGKVLAYLLVCNCCIQIVTEMMNTAYMQEIVRW